MAASSLFSRRAAALRDFVRSAFSSPLNALLSLLILAALAAAAPPLIDWALLEAVWTGNSPRDCAGREGACWLFITMRLEDILYGSYPAAERWRVNLAAGLGLAGVLVLTARPARRRLGLAAALIAGYAAVAGVLLCGGILGLRATSTSQWGGLALTLVISAWTITTALPLGLLLALARRSSMPVIAALAGGFIDIVRGLPLIGILFLAIVMFPLFAPPGLETDKLVRALLAFSMFNAANLAEVFRGGLQATPRAQEEAGLSLGLGPWQTTWLIVIPQAIAISLPGLVNVCIAIVKETTIVLIVGLFDFLGILQAGLADPDWLAVEQARMTAYMFAAIVFWCVCFGLSRYSAHLERTMGAGEAKLNGRRSG